MNSDVAEGPEGVDPGALALAAIAAGAAFILGPGEWDVLALVVGLALLATILAHHRSGSGQLTVRGLLLRISFAGIASLSLCIALAWPVQELIIKPFFHRTNPQSESVDAYDATLAMSYAWFVLTALVTSLEPRINKLLQKPIWRNRGNIEDEKNEDA